MASRGAGAVDPEPDQSRKGVRTLRHSAWTASAQAGPSTGSWEARPCTLRNPAEVQAVRQATTASSGEVRSYADAADATDGARSSMVTTSRVHRRRRSQRCPSIRTSTPMRYCSKRTPWASRQPRRG